MTEPTEIERRPTARRGDAGAPVVTAPGRLPVLGHLLQLVHPSRLAFVQSLRDHGPVVRIFMGRKPTYVLNSPEALRQMLLVQAKKFKQGRLFEEARPFIGNGILASDGELHIRQRRTMQPAFHSKQVSGYVARMSEISRQYVASWRLGKIVSVVPEMRRLASTLISHVLFRADLAREMAIAIEETLPILAGGVAWRVLGFGRQLEGLPTPGNRRFAAARERLWRTTEELIAAYVFDPADRGDLVSLLLAARDPETGAPMSKDELRDEIITIFIAGVEALATVVSWAIHRLSIHELVAQRVREEVDGVIGERPITYDDIKQLSYLRAFVTEVLRCHTPNLLITRDTTEAVEIEGVKIPANTEVMYSPATLHRDPALYPEPKRFDPTRWLEGSAPAQHRCAFIPFGVGGRSCIGESLAMTELHIIVASIVAKWRVMPASSKPVVEVPAILIQPPEHFAIRVAAREAMGGWV